MKCMVQLLGSIFGSGGKQRFRFLFMSHLFPIHFLFRLISYLFLVRFLLASNSFPLCPIHFLYPVHSYFLLIPSHFPFIAFSVLSFPFGSPIKGRPQEPVKVINGEVVDKVWGLDA